MRRLLRWLEAIYWGDETLRRERYLRRYGN